MSPTWSSWGKSGLVKRFVLFHPVSLSSHLKVAMLLPILQMRSFPELLPSWMFKVDCELTVVLSSLPTVLPCLPVLNMIQFSFPWLLPGSRSKSPPESNLLAGACVSEERL